MTPSARTAAAIEILEILDEAPPPTERTVSAYFRARRFIGAKDRRAISAQVFGALRHQARLAWHLGRCDADDTARKRVLAYDCLVAKLDRSETESRFDGSRYGPSPLSAAEFILLDRLKEAPLESGDMPEATRAECPAWLWPSFEDAFGEAATPELSALKEEAPLDLRVNTLKGNRDDARQNLADEGIEALPTALSPWGLRVLGRRAVQATKPYQEGLIEIQDEGSQLAAALCDALPGMAVLDFCAGAGGKALALAATMKNEGQLILHDRDAKRLGRASSRLRRGDVRIAHIMNGKNEGLRELEGRCQRVLVDAPCSGTGRWRREPDSRWRLTAEALTDLAEQQKSILRDAARFVAPGGRLVYVTCSLLPAENEAVRAWFLTENDSFKTVPYTDVWRRVVSKESPGAGDILTLTPRRHGTDGFYVALLERRGEKK